MVKRVFAVTMMLVLLCIVAEADVFNLGAGLTNLETVTVGDAGNAGKLSGSSITARMCGSVDYSYNIGKYEITAAQYVDFLNAKAKTDPYMLYNWRMNPQAYVDDCNISCSESSGRYTYSVASNYANRPVTLVSYWDACRFANWLNNGQGDGDTETGAYTLDGYNGDDGRSIQRNVGWKWAVASEDEWFKAAYYKGGSTTAGYWEFPTGSNTAPGNDIADVSGNNANYRAYGGSGAYPIDSGMYYKTVVGEFHNSASPYGTFDQCGNVTEWTETLITGASRSMRGGYYNLDYPINASSRGINYWPPSFESGSVGFRVVQAVPEPSSIITLAGGLASLLGMRRHRA